MDKKQKFHVVQLAMFNADVLATAQRASDENRDSEVAKILGQCALRNVANVPPMPSTVNQSLYFGMAYLALVWLRESLSQDEVNNALASRHMDGVWDDIKISGPRNLNANQQKLRLIRNALGHGNVSIDDSFTFDFWDQNTWGRNLEDEPTHIFISNENLGALTVKFYYAVSGVLYPGSQA